MTSNTKSSMRSARSPRVAATCSALSLRQPTREGSGCFRVITSCLGTVLIVDDNSAIREAMRDLLQENGYQVEVFTDGSRFLESYHQGSNECVLIDVVMPGMSSVELIERLRSNGYDIPVIVISRNAAASIALQSMKVGAVDFIEKPVCCADLLASIQRALNHTEDYARTSVFRKAAIPKVTRLTSREQQILDLILAGQPNKNIAAELGISQRTVEAHRAAIMNKTGSENFSALVRTALCARCTRKIGSEA